MNVTIANADGSTRAVSLFPLFVFDIIALAFAIFIIATLWRIFTKAGRPGWAAIVPFYNHYVLLQVAGKPGWWLVLYFIPFVNLVILILMCAGLAQKFGKGTGFVLGLLFLPFIFGPILAFGSAQYQPAAPPSPA